MINRKPLWLRKELEDLTAMREASKYYKPQTYPLTVEKLEKLRKKIK